MGAQGGQYKYVILILIDGCLFDTNRNVYTAFSRTMVKLIFIGVRSKLEKAIITEDPDRKTGLATKIIRMCSVFKESLKKLPQDIIDLAYKKATKEEHLETLKQKKIKNELKLKKLYKKNENNVPLLDRDVLAIIFKCILDEGTEESIRNVLKLGHVCTLYYNMSQSDLIWKDFRIKIIQKVCDITPNPNFILMQLDHKTHFDMFCNSATFLNQIQCKRCKCIQFEFNIIQNELFIAKIPEIYNELVKTVLNATECINIPSKHHKIQCCQMKENKSICFSTFTISMTISNVPDVRKFNYKMGEHQYVVLECINMKRVFDIRFMRHYI
jgi:hypothetical protein